MNSFTLDTGVALVALIVSLLALGMSVHFWRRQFRPIVTVAVMTNKGGTEAITYDLVVQNSGSIPARCIRIRALDQAQLDAALDVGATRENKADWLAAFEESTVIHFLHNGANTRCAFGMTQRPPKPHFWKPGAAFQVEVTYRGWFGRSFRERQTLRIIDTDSFTGHMWGA